jgi:sugar phosphate isomerase/epimerase
MYASFNARAVGLSLSAAETLELAAGAGFGGVDLLVRDLVDTGEDVDWLRARMDDLGLRGGAFPNPVQWRRDAATFQRDLARLPRLAEAAARLGLQCTGTWVLPETPALTGAGADHAAVAQMHLERLGALGRTLEPFGIRLGLEVISVASFRTGCGVPFVTRMADLDPLLKPLLGEAPNVGIVLDGWHLYAAGESVEAGLSWGVEKVVWTHIADLPAEAPRDPLAMNDNIRGLPGENGAIDCTMLLQRLANAGYAGPVTPEPMPGCRTLLHLNPQAVVARVAQALRSVWPLPWR